MAVPAPHKTTIVVLPPTEGSIGLLLGTMRAPSVQVVPPSECVSAELAVADLRTVEGIQALEALRQLPAGMKLPVVGIVSFADGAGVREAARFDVVELVDANVLAAELGPRLHQAQARVVANRQAQRQQRDLSLLLQLTADYAESLDVKELLHDVTRRLAEEMDILRASLVVLDEERGTGFIMASSDDAALRDLPIELSRYPEIREVVRTRKPVIVEDAPSHPLLEGVKAKVVEKGIHAIAALPLTVRGKVLGVLLLRASERRGAFSPREIDFLATVAHATAVALRNARLIESVRGQTEREKHARIAAEERAADLQRYESYFANFSDGIAILDHRACVVSLNPAGAKLLDVSAKEARGMHINALANAPDEGLILDLLLAVRDGTPPREVDLPVRTGTGRRLTLSVCAAPLKDFGAAAILSFRDVTVQRQLAEELRKTKEFLERLIDSSVDAIIAADLEGRIILFNKGAEEITGYTAAEAIAHLNARDLYLPGHARDVMARLRSPEFGGAGRLNVCREDILSKTGVKVPVNLTAAILYEGEREVATVGIFTDLRDRMQLERKLSDAETRLEESEKNAVIVALAGTAAHELNQPLTSVMGYAELLKRRLKEDDFAYRPVDIIYREAERMAEIVRKIGKITRYETKSYVGAAQIVDLDKATSHDE